MFEFVTAHWVEITAAVTAVVVAIDKIVKLTPTKADDAFVAKVEAALDVIGISADKAK
ncbi:hypothetical protein [Phyllobacterium endophyticum]|uniref:hypothetical protein n=1 Tax=Phyllobacterium endophyticum TaxID=1149773 RepID=UPI00164F6B2D|nr:hypothetical protein [Phyllobacterium endophyticum]